MNEDQLTDLKQFIAATVSQATADLATKQDLTNLEKKVDDGFAGVGEAIEQINQRLDVRDKGVDQRFMKFEQQTA